MKNSLETRLGIFFALCFIVAVIVLEMAGVADYFKPGYRIHANFTSVGELKKGDPVKMAGVEIGRVEDISLTNELVRVSMKIRKADAQIRTDSKATILFTGLMGANYVNIKFGKPGSPKAEDGFTLQTEQQSDLNSLVTKLDEVADGVKRMSKDLSTETLTGQFAPIMDFFKSPTNSLNTALDNMRKITGQVAGDFAATNGTVAKLLFKDDLYNQALTAVTSVQAGANDLKAIATDFRGIVNDVNSGKGTLGLLVRDEALYRESTTAMTNLREIMQKINRGDGTVGKLINDDSFYKNAKVSLQKLDQATEGLEDQGPLSVLGMAVGKLF